MELCNKCDGMMLPLEKSGNNFLRCNSCGNMKPLKEELRESYRFTKTKEHPIGTEFKNLSKMENWRQKKNKK